jgi:hypothetical protein
VLGPTSSSRFSENDHDDASNNEGLGSWEAHENLLYLTPIFPPSNQTSPLVVNSRDLQNGSPTPHSGFTCRDCQLSTGERKRLERLFHSQWKFGGRVACSTATPVPQARRAPTRSAQAPTPTPPNPRCARASPWAAARGLSQAVQFLGQGLDRARPATTCGRGARADRARFFLVPDRTSPVSLGTPRNLA